MASSNTLTVSEEFIAGLGSSTADAFAGATYGSANSDKSAYDRSAATGTVKATKSAAPNVSTSLQLMLCVFTSASSRTVYFANNTATTDTAALTQTFSDFNRFTIFTAHRSSGYLLPAACTVAEIHVFNAALTSSDFTTLLTTKPDGGGIASWVDGWALASASGLTSLGGSRVLTATGSPTTAALTLPYTRAGGGGFTSRAYYDSIVNQR
jgi:hypothetical protein